VAPLARTVRRRVAVEPPAARRKALRADRHQELSASRLKVIHADVALLAVIFEDATRVRLRWTAGYGRDAGCLRADAHLRAQALDAARAMP
jgi:hypothetical protein